MKGSFQPYTRVMAEVLLKPDGSIFSVHTQAPNDMELVEQARILHAAASMLEEE